MLTDNIATADHLPSSLPISTILICHINPLHILLHCIHEASLWSPSLSPSWELHTDFFPLSLFITCPDRLSLTSLTFQTASPQPLTYSFLILFILVTPIFSSATRSKPSCKLPFHSCLISFCHKCCSTWLALYSSPLGPVFSMVNPRYANSSTLTISAPCTFTVTPVALSFTYSNFPSTSLKSILPPL